MNFLDNEHKRKSAMITTVILILFVFSALMFGLTYWDPPQEFGIAVNFGTSDVGQGDDQPTAAIQAAPIPTQKASSAVIPAKVLEKVVTQDLEEAPVIKEKPVKKTTTVTETKPTVVQKTTPTPDKSTSDALSSILKGNKSDGKATGGEGNDNQAGDKGQIDGDPNAKGYYGTGGTGGGGDYQLGNRKPLNKPKPNYICDEVGVVVVQIEVDRAGHVINAIAGVKGTTNSAECLKSEAKIAALKTTWQPDSNATSKQIGYIRYRFSISQ
ncbi:MAG: energy transducer TonB [Flavobacteriaceae bacterium]|nr:energy transducer TonB [Flavobacteriaceae bacterium]